MARNSRNPQEGQHVHGFQVRTPICHIVPVSRAYEGGGGSDKIGLEGKGTDLS